MMQAAYGIGTTAYRDDAEMFELVHQVQTRIMTSRVFDSNRVLGAILFEDTMDHQVDGRETARYPWRNKGIVPFLKIDKGLEPEAHGVQLMRPIPDLQPLLARAQSLDVFGTKACSLIMEPNEDDIAAVVAQQSMLAGDVLAAGLVPIVEPQIDIRSAGKAKAENLLKAEITDALGSLPSGSQIILKLSLPDRAGFYTDLVVDVHVIRLLALSGGFSRAEAVEILARNPSVVASFSRALLEGLCVGQSDEEFEKALDGSLDQIFQASIM